MVTQAEEARTKEAEGDTSQYQDQLIWLFKIVNMLSSAITAL